MTVGPRCPRSTLERGRRHLETWPASDMLPASGRTVDATSRGIRVPASPVRYRSRSTAQSVGARHRGMWLDRSLVPECTRRLMPRQAAVVAAVGSWVARGQCALTFVELPGRCGPAAGHDSIEHPIGRMSTCDRSCSQSVYARLVGVCRQNSDHLGACVIRWRHVRRSFAVIPTQLQMTNREDPQVSDTEEVQAPPAHPSRSPN